MRFEKQIMYVAFNHVLCSLLAALVIRERAGNSIRRKRQKTEVTHIMDKLLHRKDKLIEM